MGLMEENAKFRLFEGKYNRRATTTSEFQRRTEMGEWTRAEAQLAALEHARDNYYPADVAEKEAKLRAAAAAVIAALPTFFPASSADGGGDDPATSNRRR